MSVDITKQGPSSLKRASDAAESPPQGQAPTSEPTTQGDGGQRDLGEQSLGVVFVHGMGQQHRAEILLEWSNPIVRAVADWTASVESLQSDGWNGDRVERSEIDFEGGELPLVTVRVPGATIGGVSHQPQKWVMTEARWAQHVEPPSLQTMIDWCGPSGVVAEVIGRIVDHSMTGQKAEARALAKMGLATFVTVVVSFALLGYAVLRAVAGLIPYKPLQDALARLQLDTFLTASWGDVYLLLNDPVQAANIRGQVAQSVRALRKYGCARIAVVSHSGGTIVSYMALADPAYEGDDVRAAADLLITHGQAIGMARRIHERGGGLPTSPGAQLQQERHLRDLGTTGWHDYYGTHDPAPAGPPDEARANGKQVWNRLSLADDHGNYWSNDEEFVNDVLVQFDVARRPNAASRFQLDEIWVGRRRQRVFVLALWKRLMFVLPLLAVMAAFLHPTTALIPALRDSAYKAASIVPGSTELGQAVHTLPNLPGHGFFVNAAASLVALLAILAIIQAILPIAHWDIWSGWRRYVFAFLDAGIFLALIGVAVAFRVGEGGPLDAVKAIFSRVLDPPVLAAFLLAIGIYLMLAVSRVSDLFGGSREGPSLARRLTVVSIGLAVVFLIVYGLLEDRSIRMMIIGGGVAFLLFQLLGRVGTWRWAGWDEEERRFARRRRPGRLYRGWVWVQFLALGLAAGLLTFAIATGVVIAAVYAAGVLAAAIGVFVIADVIRREPI